MEDHQTFCGSRTDICNSCGARVLLQDWAAHVLAECAQSTTTLPLAQGAAPMSASDRHLMELRAGSGGSTGAGDEVKDSEDVAGGGGVAGEGGAQEGRGAKGGGACWQ